MRRIPDPPPFVANHRVPFAGALREWRARILRAPHLLGSVIPDEHGRPFAPASLGKLKARPFPRGKRRKAIEARLRQHYEGKPPKRPHRFEYRTRAGLARDLDEICAFYLCVDPVTMEAIDPATAHESCPEYLSAARLAELAGHPVTSRKGRGAPEAGDKTDRARGVMRAAKIVIEVEEFRRERRDAHGKTIYDEVTGLPLYESTGPARCVASDDFIKEQGGNLAFTFGKWRQDKCRAAKRAHQRNRFSRRRSDKQEATKAAEFKGKVEAQHAPAPEPLPPVPPPPIAGLPDPIAAVIAQVEAEHTAAGLGLDFARVRAEAKARMRRRAADVDTS